MGVLVHHGEQRQAWLNDEWFIDIYFNEKFCIKQWHCKRQAAFAGGDEGANGIEIFNDSANEAMVQMRHGV